MLTGFGWEGIRDAGWGTDVELGAWLFGRVDGHELVVHQTGGWVVGDSNSVRFSSDAAALEDHFGGAGWKLVGHVHSHPHSERLEPSRADRSAYADLSHGLKQDVVGLIVGPNGDLSWPFSPLTMAAWLQARADGRLRPLPVVVEENNSYGH